MLEWRESKKQKMKDLLALYQKFIPEWGLTIYLLLFLFSGMYIWSGQLYQDLNKKFGNKK
jgi:hypothetical protein